MLTVEPQVVEQYARPGKVRLIFRDILAFGEQSERASVAAVSAGLQGQFWPMHAILFEDQSNIFGKSGGALVALMKEYAARLPGLDQAAFAKSLDDPTILPALKAAEDEHRKRGVTSRPVFEIGQQRLVGYQSFEVMQRAIEAALK